MAVKCQGRTKNTRGCENKWTKSQKSSISLGLFIISLAQAWVVLKVQNTEYKLRYCCFSTIRLVTSVNKTRQKRSSFALFLCCFVERPFTRANASSNVALVWQEIFESIWKVVRNCIKHSFDTMIGSRAWFALMRRDIIYRRRNIIGSVRRTMEERFFAGIFVVFEKYLLRSPLFSPSWSIFLLSQCLDSLSFCDCVANN